MGTGSPVESEAEHLVACKGDKAPKSWALGAKPAEAEQFLLSVKQFQHQFSAYAS